MCAVCEVGSVAEVVVVVVRNEVFEMEEPKYRLPCGLVLVGSGHAGLGEAIFCGTLEKVSVV